MAIDFGVYNPTPLGHVTKLDSNVLAVISTTNGLDLGTHSHATSWSRMVHGIIKINHHFSTSTRINTIKMLHVNSMIGHNTTLLYCSASFTALYSQNQHHSHNHKIEKIKVLHYGASHTSHTVPCPTSLTHSVCHTRLTRPMCLTHQCAL